MACRAPIVDQRASFHGLQKRRDIWLADFHLKRGSYAVQRLQPLAFQIHVVLMQINETGSNNQTFGRDHALAVETFSGNFFDPALTDADIADRIKASFRIDDAAALNYNVV